MDLATLTILIGIVIALPQVYGLIKPGELSIFARGLARNRIAGYVLIFIGAVWFLRVLEHETLADFEVYKSKMQIFFVLLGVGACVYLKDFLAVRGLAVVMLLLAKTVIETARYAETDWRLVLIVMSYIWIIFGMIFTVSPWRFRDMVNWTFSSEERIRRLCILRLALALLLVGLGLTVFKTPAIAAQ